MYPPATVDGEADRILAELRSTAASRGLLDRSEEIHVLRVACGALLLAALALFAWAVPSLAASACFAALAGGVSVQIGFAAHDAGHGAVSDRPWVNELVGQLAFTIVNGLGFESWKLSDLDPLDPGSIAADTTCDRGRWRGRRWHRVPSR